VRIALTANGPGEVAGWLRPLLRSLYERDPQLEAYVFLVPDDYATGAEARMARALFPGARVYEPNEYVRFALGRSVPGGPETVDVVQYLGGDLMHAARVHKRLGGRAMTYKFAKPRYARTLFRAFAVDAKNAEQLRHAQVPDDRIETVGNLVIDGAMLEADQPVEAMAPDDGVLIMPGSRPYEVEQLVPFFFTVARRMLRERPELRLAFGISPFTDLDALAKAIERGGDPRVWAETGRLVTQDGAVFLESLDGATRIPVLHNALAAARRARLTLTLPGTKVTELATLGVPVLTITPLNAPEMVTFNGPLTYLDRVPLIGIPLKRAAAVAVSHRFEHHTQPNMDLNEAVVWEMKGTLTPGRVARVALERFDDRAWQATTSQRLRALYARHAGAADRMATAIVESAA
jgi:lipid-A-disaccharide synthase